jgi:hypothetical protein
VADKNNYHVGKLYFRARESIFDRTVHIFLNYSRAEFEEWCKKRGFSNTESPEEIINRGREFSGFSTQLGYKNRPSEWVIVVHNFTWSIASQGTLLHEAVHTIIKIWALQNIPVNADTQEFMAHTISNLFEDIAYKVFARTKKKGK